MRYRRFNQLIFSEGKMFIGKHPYNFLTFLILMFPTNILLWLPQEHSIF